ncbi:MULTISPECIES: hypothetical protein [Clostridium]|uniref:hypothetical protein n=1 Tax=Clostridium TaxID=1485 RepID=UPI00024BA79A|nr:hypothetical protein [Clostridium sporogenes]STC76917.1 Uncharacterised protein [Clostridium botulinum]EHN14503.1 hypothetical protein IYC_13544 [Clostridium sporogenes PA 3679]KRU42203.1 hypothetical protein VT94_16580 [Clostridium sporogenes]MBA4509761.1 hypothetical protein [Clostridium sporogenes]MBY7066282.1 hypothetical protein [Clostridium sporogenes]
MGQSVVVKKEEKVTRIFNEHGLNISENEFIEIFKNEYPKDWNRINKVYEDEEKTTKPGKSHPMPEPIKYLKNTYKVYKKKLEKSLK